MKVALVHSFYASGQPSGENEAVRDQVGALSTAGHEVHLVAAHTDELSRDPLYPLRAAGRVATGWGANPLAELREFGPDVVHVHNLFPNFSRSWVTSWPGPLVATVHNYRPLCAAGDLYRDGAVCTRCPDGDRWAGLRHGCYRGSRLATAPLAWAGRGGAGGDPVLARADRVVVLSESARETYERAGVGAGRLAVIPNFVVDGGGWARTAPVDAPWIFVGRLSAEKGVLELLRRWPEGEPLDVVGDGPLAGDCRAVAPSSVRFHGQLGRAEVRRLLPRARGLVFPSRCREGAPLVQVEALAAGVPVLAFEGSAVADVVRERGVGVVTGWDAPLGPVLVRAAGVFSGLRAWCRRTYEEEFGERTWVERMLALYGGSGRGRGGMSVLEKPGAR
ncbi:glycosyltransferase family 4 protein [Streptomyces sp. NPDC059009]|uniref:glycosyltransferase family 4 protein n=1 Tax=Streptomyces sp. NPDC059009 TaxID=3346694 RepID=UPI0036C84D18